ncbi:uncharacterized protein LOC133368381 [Rhineura floridana]|uniref:uncharacterized protein LOC133368381 n=1 Tax=Rhineura floridana TaxID=261503 RepID=UPI002AC8572D|nr:uncharacterized protein LOC133368381 [Rhineura floridana]
MTPFKSTMLHLLFLGVLYVSPAYLQQAPCEIAKNTFRRGTYKLDVDPTYYKPGAIYTVSISGIDNSTSVILQVLPSSGLWESENQLISCSTTENIVQRNISGNNTRTRWIAPNNVNVESVLIRSFVSFANGTSLLQTLNLDKDVTIARITYKPLSTPQPGTVSVSSHKPALHSNSTDAHHTLLNSTTEHHNFASSHEWTKEPHSSVSTAQASSFLLALMQLLSVSLGYKLLS